MIKEAEKYLNADQATKFRLMDYYNNNCYPYVDPKRKYKIQRGDNWCAMFTTVIAHRCGIGSDRFPYEVSVFFQMEKAKRMGIFYTDRSKIQPNDLIIYDWDRNGTMDHVGIVVSKGNEAARLEWEKVARQVGETDFRRDPSTGQYLNPGVDMDWSIHAKAKGYDYIKVIEGNKNDSVGYRVVPLHSTAVVGFISTGYSALQADLVTPEPTEDERIGKLAKETIQGRYGNGNERKQALGKDYERVQAWITNYWH